MINLLFLLKPEETERIKGLLRDTVFENANIHTCFSAEDAGKAMEEIKYQCFVFDSELLPARRLNEVISAERGNDDTRAVVILSGKVIAGLRGYSEEFDIPFLLKPVSGQFLLNELYNSVRSSDVWDSMPDDIKYKVIIAEEQQQNINRTWQQALSGSVYPTLNDNSGVVDWVKRRYKECAFGRFPERLCPISLTILDWTVFSGRRIQSALMQALYQIISVNIPDPETAIVFEQYSSTVLILLNPSSGILSSEELKECCCKIVEGALSGCGLRLMALYGKFTDTREMGPAIEKLTFRVKNNISREAAAVGMEDPVPEATSLPDTMRLCDLIVGGYRDAAKNLIREEIYRLPEQFKINSDYIFAYQLELLQNLFSALKGRGVNAGRVFRMRRQFLDLFDIAGRSQINLINWVYWLTDTVCDRIEQGENSLVEKVRRYAEQNVSGDLSRKAIANELHISESRLSHVFKEYTDMSLTQYVTEIRIAHAKFLLTRTDLPVAQIASESGFSNGSYFARVFCNSTGYTPVHYRELYQKFKD